jgi:peptide/nickel transport system substrate-binding protein
MVRRIRWQILIAVISSVLVLTLMSYLAITTAAVQRPVEGGDYVEGLLYTPRQLNPLIEDSSGDLGANDIQALVFDGLVHIGPSGLSEPALALSWTVDQTGQIYTFVLRDGVRWHDGNPVTIKDVLFTISAIQGPAYAGNPSISAIWRNVTVDQIDERTFSCRLSAPFAAFLEYSTFPILPAHMLATIPPEQWAATPFAQLPIGTGPYRIAELSAGRALLRANPSYYRGRAFIDSIELRYYDNQQVALNDLVRGEIQGLSFASTSELRTFNLPRMITRRSAPLDGYTTLTFNLRNAPLSNLGLRRALATGLDRQELITRTFDGQAIALETPILPQWWAAASEVGWPPTGVERATALLTDLGYVPGPNGVRQRDGQALVFDLITDGAPDRLAAAQEVARQWSLIGVTVNVQQLDAQELQRRLSTHQFSIAIHAWQRLGADPDIYELWHSSQAEQGRNYAGLQDTEIDTLIGRARQEGDMDARMNDYSAFQHRFVDLAPSIPLYQPLLFYATNSTLGGIDIDTPANTPAANPQLLIGRESRFRNVTRWFLRSAREIRGDLRQP